MGRELLVKTVAQALPLYSMQCFLLPKSFCEELNLLIAKFWWSGDPKKGKFTGLIGGTYANQGMKEVLVLEIYLALLAKKAWRLLQDSESLVFRVFKARYFPMVDFLQAKVTSNSSYVWRSIVASRPVI